MAVVLEWNGARVPSFLAKSARFLCTKFFLGGCARFIFKKMSQSPVSRNSNVERRIDRPKSVVGGGCLVTAMLVFS